MQEFLKLDRSIVVNKTLDWLPVDTKEQYERVSKTMDIPYGPNDITYKFNNYGFRCDDFNSWENYPYRILFAGCSMTEGIGVPLEDLWAKKLHTKIVNKIGFEIPYWTIASGATGLDHMSRYLFHLKDMLRPQIIISHLPSNVRRERWHEDRWSIWNLDYDIDKHTAILADENLVNYQTEKNLAMINIMLEEIDSWFFCSSDIDISLSRFIKKDIFLEQIDFGRDGLHAGPKSNDLFANITFDVFWPNIQEKLGLDNAKRDV